MNKHIHHIIPKHMGGSNEDDNLIELTISEHAEAHRILFEKHQHWQDYVAWKALSGQINSDEIRRMVISETLKGKSKTPEHRKKLSDSAKKRKASNETKKKMSDAQKGRIITWDLKANTPELRKRKSELMSGISKQKIACPHCNKIGGLPQMKRWHFDNCKDKK